MKHGIYSILILGLLGNKVLANAEEHQAPAAAPNSATSEPSPIKNEKEVGEIIDLSTVQSLIKKDGLEGELKKQQQEKQRILDEKRRTEMKKYNVPSENDFWKFMSEKWLVKNVTYLKWDFQKADFELEKSFSAFLEQQGYFEKKFKILLCDSNEVFHLALPSSSDEVIFLLSMKLVRSLDLSKLEISILLFEDYLRWKNDLFKKMVTNKDIDQLIGSNFNGKTLDKAAMDALLKRYSEVAFEKGFTFQQQFDITKEMESSLKSDLKNFSAYLLMLEKLDNLVKSSTLYKKYNQIYPSPELQINWLRPKEKIL